METRDEILEAAAARYGAATRVEKGRILTEFAEIAGYHRMHAERLLQRDHVVDRSQPRPGRRVYNEALREALVVLWEAADRICGKHLKSLIPLLIPAMERQFRAVNRRKILTYGAIIPPSLLRSLLGCLLVRPRHPGRDPAACLV